MINFEINGVWEKYTLNEKIMLLENSLKNINNNTVTFSFFKLEKIDSSGIILLIQYIKKLEKNNCTIEIINISKKHKKMLDFYSLKL